MKIFNLQWLTPANAGNNASRIDADTDSSGKGGGMKEQQELLELFGGNGAAQAAGYETLSGFRKALAQWPIRDQGYRYNGKPVWTREHLEAWRESVPAAGWPAKNS